MVTALLAHVRVVVLGGAAPIPLVFVVVLARRVARPADASEQGDNHSNDRDDRGNAHLKPELLILIFCFFGDLLGLGLKLTLVFV